MRDFHVMFHFTIRDVLWLMVVVAVALTFWLGWSKETAMMREESAARDAELQDQVVAERDLWKTKTKELMKAHSESMVKWKIQEATANKQREIASDRKSEIVRLEEEVRQLKATLPSTDNRP